MPGQIVPVIMCGGAGTRLWPLSREVFPKQFISLFGGRSTFQQTIERVADPELFERPIVITGAAYCSVVLDQLSAIGAQADVLLESARRDSGPAIVAGALFARQRDPASIVLALAADHIVKDSAGFIAACEAAIAAARGGRIVTFGVEPDRAATEYGYISPGAAIDGPVRDVSRFVEKPDLATATRYVREGYLWNSGNFMFCADVLLDEYRQADSGSVDAVSQAILRARREASVITVDKAAFETAKPISIDYAVMECTRRAAVIPVSFGWSDVGSWRTVWDLSEKDDHGNVTQGNVVVEDARNCLVSTDGPLIALEGVDDLVVVSTADAVLISHQADANGMKRLVEKLKTASPEVMRGRAPGPVTVPRPAGERYSARRMVIAPGGSYETEASRRAAHWIVVTGEGVAVIGGARKALHGNDAVYVPAGTASRLENVAQAFLVLIEVAADV